MTYGCLFYSCWVSISLTGDIDGLSDCYLYTQEYGWALMQARLGAQLRRISFEPTTHTQPFFYVLLIPKLVYLLHGRPIMQMSPGRQLLTRSPHRRVGLISCPWLQSEQIQYESLLEKSFVQIALLCPFVKIIKSQPFRITLSNGKSYTPDYLLSCFHADKVVVEVKPSVFIEKHRELLLMAKTALESMGYAFIVCSDHEIKSNNRSGKASEILRQARSKDSEKDFQSVCLKLDRLNFPQTIESLSSWLGLTQFQVMGFIGRRKLFVRPDLSLDSIFSFDAYRESGNEQLSPGSWLGYSNW